MSLQRSLMTAFMSQRQTLIEDAPADADRGNWVDAHAPVFARPYLRLMRADRPIGTWLLLLPCWHGLALGVIAGGVADIGYLYFAHSSPSARS